MSLYGTLCINGSVSGYLQQLPVLLSVLLVAISCGTGPRVKLVGCNNALNLAPTHPAVDYCTDRFKAVFSVLDLRFVALWFILRGDLF